MMRAAFILLLLLFASCASQAPQEQQTSATSATPAACRIGPDDGPVLAERGIGGTGLIPFANPAPASGNAGTAPSASPPAQDRGIGGTGSPAPAQTAGQNTGIVGEITGFASICLNGVEVAYPPGVSVEVDGDVAATASLRVGQVVAIEASPDADAVDGLRANLVAVRHEVSGPIEILSAGIFLIAGQAVSYDTDTCGAHPLHIGDWVAVSGLRNANGTIEASRIDRRAPGAVMVHGSLAMRGGRFWLGGIKLKLSLQTMALETGQAVTVSGALRGDELIVQSMTPDLLFSDPTAYFGPQVGQFLLQSYIASSSGQMFLAGGAAVSLSPESKIMSLLRPSILSLQRSPDGRLRAVDLIPGEPGSVSGFSTGPPSALPGQAGGMAPNAGPRMPSSGPPSAGAMPPGPANAMNNGPPPRH